jgi:predicted ATPase
MLSILTGVEAGSDQALSATMNSSVQVIFEKQPVLEGAIPEEEEDSPEEEVPLFRQKQRILDDAMDSVNVFAAIKAQWNQPSLKEQSVRSMLQETLTTVSSTSFSTIGSGGILETTEEDLGKTTELLHEEISRRSPRTTSSEETLALDEKIVASLRADAVQAIRDIYHQVISSRSPRKVALASSTLSHKPMTTRMMRNASTVSSAVTTTTATNDAAVINTLLLVTGPTGSGKTHLLQTALRGLAQASGGFYIRGKFDMLQHPDPYCVFSTAFTDWAQQVMQRGPATIRHYRDAIRAEGGSETCLLLTMIPALREILCYRADTEVPPPAPPDPSITHLANRHWNDDASQRFAFVFPLFLRAITKTPVPIVLVVDDLHWSDPCSLDVLCSVVTEHYAGIVVVGTYDGEYTSHMEQSRCDVPGEEQGGERPLHECAPNPSVYLTQKLLELEQNHALVVQTVSIDNLNTAQIHPVCEHSLAAFGSLPEELCPLVMEETQGSLFLMDQFLKWLQGQQLLPQPNATTSWNLERIREVMRERTKQFGASAYFIMDRLHHLPLDMLDVLKVAACFGHSRMEDTLIEYVLDFPVENFLSQLVDMGILVMAVESSSSNGNMYFFQHDIWQRVAYDLIAENSRELFHLEIGRRLWRRLSKDELDRNIYVILSQMIQGRRLISRATERYGVASLCLHAGRRAAKSSTFRVATVYLNFGIELLGESGWREEYDLTLSIYNASAEMAMCTAHFEVVKGLVESVLQHARSAGDKVAARATQLYALGVTDRQQEGLDLGLQLLSDLGSPLPSSFCRVSFFRELMSVKRMLRGKSNCYLKRLPSVDSDDVLASLQILNLVGVLELMKLSQHWL